MRKIIALALTGFMVLGATAHAQPKGHPAPNMIAPDQIDPAEGPRILQAFRSARTSGDYAFNFELINKPKGGKSQTYTGRMYGTWTAGGVPLSRTDIDLPEDGILHMVYSGGAAGHVLVSHDDEKTVQLKESDRFKPIVNGLTFTAFDLQMSFMQWTDYVYEGTKKLLGRPAHYFILYPPDNTLGETNIAAVRVAIDADFLIMLSAEELDADSAPIKKFRINDFAKVDGQWIVREIDLVDSRTKDRTRFRVSSAKVGLQLPAEIFTPQTDGTLGPVN